MKTYIVYCPELGEDVSGGHNIQAISHDNAISIYLKSFWLPEDAKYKIYVLEPESNKTKSFIFYKPDSSAYTFFEIPEQSEPQS